MAEIAIEEIRFPLAHKIFQTGILPDVDFHRTHTNTPVVIDIEVGRMVQNGLRVRLHFALDGVNH